MCGLTVNSWGNPAEGKDFSLASSSSLCTFFGRNGRRLLRGDTGVENQPNCLLG